ncbi:MAG: phage portal protein [Pseudomonadales bacterium]|nr:phage portal protein [Pseudomonadales bacterium]
MSILSRVRNWSAEQVKGLIDHYPAAAVALDPFQFYQRGLDLSVLDNSGPVASCEGGLDAYAQAMAQMRLQHMRQKGQAHEIIRESAVSRVLHTPNGYQTRSDFFNVVTRRLMSEGNGYAVAERDRYGRIIALHPVMAPHCQPYVDEESKAIFYSVSNNPLAPFDHGMLIPQRDVLHIKLYTPYHPLRGVSPLTYAALAMRANHALSAHQAAFFANMARPSFLLQTDEKLNETQVTQLRTAWKDQTTKLNSGQVPILTHGFKAQQLGITSQDAELVAAFRMTVEDIGRALRIPAPLMGVETTYNNAEQLIGFWLSNGLGFVINHIEQALAKFFELPQTQSIEFTTEDLMRVDFVNRVKSATDGIQGGLFSPNEARAKFNLPAVEYGDEPRLQAQTVPLSQVAMTPALSAPSAPSAPSAVEEDEKSNLVYLELAKEINA